MTAGRNAGEGRIGLEKKSPQLALLGIKFGGEIADVSGLDLVRLDFRAGDRVGDDLAHDVDEVLALARPITGEVALGAAEDIDGRLFHCAISLYERAAQARYRMIQTIETAPKLPSGEATPIAT